MADLSFSTIQEFELGRLIHSDPIEAIDVALEAAGVEFIPSVPQHAGVRLKNKIGGPK